MLVRYEQFESFEHLVETRLKAGGEERPFRCAVFGGTGAVGGAAVLQLIRLLVEAPGDGGPSGELWVTGRTDKEISLFAQRLWQASSGRAEIEKIRPRRHFRIGGRVDVHFALFSVGDLGDVEEHVAAAQEAARRKGRTFELQTALEGFFDQLPSPFLDFVAGLGFELDAVVVGIPLPSVATYTMTGLERLAEEHDVDPPTLNRIKDAFLERFLRGLATVRLRHARVVVMAHTTAVGGMYRVDGREDEIRLGFAHSAMGKKLADKKYFADRLTQSYVDQGFEVLVTAAAIGIDAVEFNTRLPMAGSVSRVLRDALEEAEAAAGGDAPADGGEGSGPALPLLRRDLDRGSILLYPATELALERGGPRRPLAFGAGKQVRFEAAVRSGENGYFSVANSLALYHVMKVAIPEELATVIVRRALFGRERRRSWFSGGISYYTETENAHFAMRVLGSDERLIRAHLGAFSIQAFQELGSATHQARLHELGILVLLLRLLDFGRRLETLPAERLEEGVRDVAALLHQESDYAYFEDLLRYSPDELAALLGSLCEVREASGLGRLFGCDPRQRAQRDRRREKLLERLAVNVRRYLSTITSLGTPIVYRSPAGRDRVLVGPYAAPLDRAVTHSDSLRRHWRRVARRHRLPVGMVRDWTVVNNGFVDLRPHALATSSRDLAPDLADRLLLTGSVDELAAWIAGLERGSYFTTCGLTATLYRLARLHERLLDRRVELGTHETWKHLFFRDRRRDQPPGGGADPGPYVLAPGLVETVRMYSEGLGKVTGTENLWPHWGY